MEPGSKVVEDWRNRLRQNGKVAHLLCERHPQLACPIVSRLYYSLHQAVVAWLVENGSDRGRWQHSEVWDAADSVQPGLGAAMEALYRWRVMADYATGRVTERKAVMLAARYLPWIRSLGIDLELDT